jgi:archaeosine synthase
MFKVKVRDGPARIGLLKERIITPTILFIDTPRFKSPDFAEAIISKKKRTDKPTLILEGLNSDICVLKKPFLKKSLLSFIIESREKSYQKALYLPGKADPSNIALLTYMGVDLFDSLQAILAARKGEILFPHGRYIFKELKEIPCSCPYCSSQMDFLQLLNHNLLSMLNEIKQVRNSIRHGNLRELVELRVRANPSLAALLRMLDLEYYSFLEERVPVIRKGKLLATSKDSLFRPEVRRFRDRILKRYKKPRCTRVLLLLPCSAKKPYSFSKSHRLFQKVLFGLKNPYVVHEVILTSPLALVPREIELTYPASSYDIPVTGQWDEEEKKMIRTALKEYLDCNRYEKVVMHLNMDFIHDLLPNPYYTCVDTPTSKRSLEKLSSVLKELTESYTPVSALDRFYENVKSLACYQFGERNAEELLKESKIEGRYPYLKIMGKSQLGVLTKERGLISLTLEGAKRIKEGYWVKMEDDFSLKGSLLAPGVKDADESIRIGEEVVIFKDGEVRGVGVAEMNGKEMKESCYGEAVKIRHLAQESAINIP